MEITNLSYSLVTLIITVVSAYFVMKLQIEKLKDKFDYFEKSFVETKNDFKDMESELKLKASKEMVIVNKNEISERLDKIEQKLDILNSTLLNYFKNGSK
jgi:regulator of sirC expression with transglutaminase-like and TPR domain